MLASLDRLGAARRGISTDALLRIGWPRVIEGVISRRFAHGIFRGSPARSTSEARRGARPRNPVGVDDPASPSAMTPTARIPPVALAEPVSAPESHRLMLAADRASARIAKWGRPLELDPRPIAFWPADFVGGDQ